MEIKQILKEADLYRGVRPDDQGYIYKASQRAKTAVEARKMKRRKRTRLFKSTALRPFYGVLVGPKKEQDEFSSTPMGAT